MIISSKYAIPSLTGTVISSKIEKINDWPPKAPSLDAIGPLLSVKVAGVGITPEQSTKKVTDAVAAYLERGTYPMFLANETTFSLKVALSMKTSLVIMLAL